jgi:hypothetical protein
MARYKCEICDQEIEPKGGSTLRLITGWVKGSSNTIKHMDTNHYRFVHEFCRPREHDENQLPLF